MNNPQEVKTYNNSIGLVQNLGDPYVFEHKDTYYLYGTTDKGSKGIKVYTSDDLINWSEPKGARDGYALHKDDVWGNRWFWSPEVRYHNNTFYMIYTVEEHLAVARSDSPLGPFTQPKHGPLHPDIKEIGHITLFDKGKIYMYWTRFDQGNIIIAAEMNDDLLSIKEETITRIIEHTEDWEHTENNPHPNWPVTEAPFIMKHNGYYYLFYTANHFRSPDYAVGYAVSTNPLGPFEKFEGSPILKSNDQIKGTGTTSVIKAPNGEYYMLYHAHYNNEAVVPRKTVMDRMEFVKQPDRSPDVVKVHGPTTSKQRVDW